MRKTDGNQEKMDPAWEDIYAELRNKMRWAIGSTIAETGVISMPFREQVALAGPLAQAALASIKDIYEKPDLRLAGGGPGEGMNEKAS